MFRKLVLAVTLALGLGGGVLATQSAEAAVVQPTASATVIQAIEQAPSATSAQKAYYYRGGYRRYGYYGGGYRPYGYYGYRRSRVCRVRSVRVRTAYGWRWVNRRVCYWR